MLNPEAGNGPGRLDSRGSVSHEHPAVIVAHPKTQHSLRLAVGLQRAGLLEAYVTQMYWDAQRSPYKYLARVPILNRVAAEKSVRRVHSSLEASRVVDLNPWAEFLLFALKYAG